MDGHYGTLGGVKANQGKPGSAEFDFDVTPVAGWGNYPPLSSIGNETFVEIRYQTAVIIDNTVHLDG